MREYNGEILLTISEVCARVNKSQSTIGNWYRAEQYYKKLFELDPKFPEGYFEYGKYLVQKGNTEEGIKYVKKALNCRFSFLSMNCRRDILDYLEQNGEDITKLV